MDLSERTDFDKKSKFTEEEEMKKKQACVEFIQDKVLNNHEFHYDRDLAALLLPKLLKGCERFMKLYKETKIDDNNLADLYEERDPLSAKESNRKLKKAENVPFEREELKIKLRKIREILAEEQQ